MVSRWLSFGLQGIDAFPVTVEVDLSGGLPAFDIVGLPDPSVKESRERVRSALKNAGFRFPARRITVNLAPADIRKAGPVYDLAILLGLLVCNGDLAGSFSGMGIISLISSGSGIFTCFSNIFVLQHCRYVRTYGRGNKIGVVLFEFY